ncbi:hypothetical protein [Trichormus sp. NMC-1]|uniref:hypothetical protein n=1 Tax=Trichormus sp. NMC-1 TaxID=1853259 RepID=UPI00115FEFB9|nr:hypothetical protein [Trichormus sp. NMC-1]
MRSLLTLDQKCDRSQLYTRNAIAIHSTSDNAIAIHSTSDNAIALNSTAEMRSLLTLHQKCVSEAYRRYPS